MQPVVLDVNDALREAYALLENVLGANLKLVLELGEDAGRIEADRSQLDQVILNLVLNARDAMPGGGTITLETGSVDLDGAAADALVVPPGRFTTIVVRDTGVGMTEEVSTHAFEPFYTTKKNAGGTGLGLATVHGIVKQSGGEIQVESSAGAGATFTVYLPCVLTEPAVDPEAAAALGPRKRASGTVLVVEDEEIVRSYMREALELSGYDVLEATNGLEALELCRHRRGEIDALVTDVMMPTMNGRELVERLEREHLQLPTVCTSGYAERSIFADHVLSPAVAFLRKPFSADDLLGKLDGVMEALL